MAYSHRQLLLPHLEGEPKSIGIAPPPYKLTNSSSPDDDSTSGRWSDTSFSSNSGLGKRRSSWSNLIEADENLKNYKVNVYPKVSSTNSTTSYSSNPMPGKLPQGIPIMMNGSNMSVNSSYGGAAQPVNYQLKPPSRQNSYSGNNSAVSEFFVMPRGSIQKLNYGSPMPPGATPIPMDNPQPLGHHPHHPHMTTTTTTTTTTSKKNRMQDIRDFFAKPVAKFACGVCCLLLIIGIILAIVLPLNLILPNHYEFNWQAPEMIRQRQTGSNNIQLDIQGDQARFNLRGNAVPFRSNYLSVYDFKSNKVAIVDSALQVNGKQIICFLMDFNRETLRDISSLKRASKNAESKNNQSSGWQERWNFVPTPATNFNADATFHPDISECRGARWVQLSFINANQKPQRCSDCYDFCLPSYGVQKDVIRDEEFLNIMNRDCFYLYVSEWRNYAQAYNTENGGQQGYQQPGGAGYGATTNMYGHPSGPQIPQQATGGTFMVANNQFQNPGQINHQQTRLGQYQQPGSPYGPGNSPIPISTGSGGGGGGGGGSMINPNYNEINRNNNNAYGNNINNPDNHESRWINLSNVPGQIVNKTGNAINQGINQVDQWGRKIGQNLGLLPSDDHFRYQNTQSPYVTNNNNNNNNPFDPRYGQVNNPTTITNPSGSNNNNNQYQGYNPNNIHDQAALRQQTLGSMYGSPGLTGMGPEYAVRQPIVGGETSSQGGFGQSQQPLLPSAVFTSPEESSRGIVGNQPVLPSNPAEFFRNQQQSLNNQGIHLQNQAQQLQQQAQTYGRDLSAATLSPSQQDQLRNQQSFINNWGRR